MKMLAQGTIEHGHLRGRKGWEAMRLLYPAQVDVDNIDTWLLVAAVDMSYETDRGARDCLAHINGQMPIPVNLKPDWMAILARSVSKHADWMRTQTPRRVATMLRLRVFRCWTPAKHPTRMLQSGTGEAMLQPQPSVAAKVPTTTAQGLGNWLGYGTVAKGVSPAPATKQAHTKPKEGNGMSKTNGTVVGVMEQSHALREFKSALVDEDLERMQHIYETETAALRQKVDVLNATIAGWERRKRAVDAMRADA